MERKKVAIIYPFFMHYRQPVFSLLLKQEGFRITLIGDVDGSGFFPSVKAWLPEEGFFRRMRVCRLFRGRLAWQFDAWRLAYSKAYDTLVLYGDMRILSMWILAFLARAQGKSVIWWGHGWRRRDGRFRGLARRRFFGLGTAMMSYGRRSQYLGRLEGFRRDRLHVIYNSLDTSLQESLRLSMDRDSVREMVRRSIFGEQNLGVVICTARLIPERQMDVLIRALARVDAVVGAIIVGDGVEKERLRALADDLGVRVHFEGACYDERRLADLYAAADVTASPGFVGLTAMHSMVYGVPVITHSDPYEQMPEWEAVVSGLTGDLFKRGDPDSLAAAITRWIGRGGASRVQTRRACHAAVERFFNPSVQVERIVQAMAGKPAIWEPAGRLTVQELTEEASVP